MERNPFETRESLLEELLAYARIYELLLKANGSDAALNACIDRLNRFETTVIRPFLMEVLRIADASSDKEEKISPEDLREIFLLVESYIFRRQICDIPTNALNKVFVALNNEIIRYDGSINNYLEKCKYALLRKVSTGIYPDDGMFAEALSTKQVYLMRPKNKQYIMERLENWGTVEVKDVWKLIEEGTYTIEHIMPQTLQSEWKEMLGPDYESIHEEWVHRLANLTLTAYNSKYSNSTFQKKRDMENGFANSGIRMNQRIAKCDKWTLPELEERDRVLIERGLKIWPMIETSYEPPVKVLDAITLADEYSLKGRKVARFSFRGAEQTVTSWVDLFMKVMSLLHAENPLVLLQLASDKTGEGLSIFVNDAQDNNNRYAKLEDGIFLWVNTDTETKISLLRRFFKLYEVDEEDLICYLRDDSDEQLDEQSSLGAIRKRFWTQALPILKEKTKRFSNIHPTVSNWQSTFIGKAGLNISAIANLEELRVELYIGTKDSGVNDEIFNYIKSRQLTIEQNAQREFIWTNEPENRTAKISLEMKELGIQNESNWIDCIEFLVEGVNIIAQYLLPEVEEYYS